MSPKRACAARRVLSEYTSHGPGSFLELDPLDEVSGCAIMIYQNILGILNVILTKRKLIKTNKNKMIVEFCFDIVFLRTVALK